MPTVAFTTVEPSVTRLTSATMTSREGISAVTDW